jgi:hypothetical protein
MRKALSATIALAIFCISGPMALATESVTFDGVWWRSLSSSEQLVAVQGLLEGYHGGFNDGWAAAYVTVALDGNASHKHFATLLDHRKSNADAVYSKTFGTYRNEITDFYDSHPSLVEKPLGLFFSCFADNPGMTCDQVARIFER